MKRIALALAISLAAISLASAQTYHDSAGTTLPGVVPLVGCSAAGNCSGPLSATNPLPVTGSLSATLSGFQPGAAYATPLAVSTSSSRVALPSGTTVIVYNTGATAAYVQLGGSSVAANTANDVIPAGGWSAFGVGSNAYLAALTSSGTTTLNVSGGSGLPTGGGGGTVAQGSAASASGAWPVYQTVGGAAMSATNGLFVNPATGATFPISGSISVSGWAGGTLGAMANYGTSPGAVLVPSVNAFVTNSNPNGQATAANASPVVLPADVGTSTSALANSLVVSASAASLSSFY